MLFDGIILKCHSQIRDDRTIGAIYHLLTGKKSIQTIQDAHIFGLKHFYGIYKTLPKDRFAQKINALTQNRLLIENTHSPQHYHATKRGLIWLEEHKEAVSFHNFNGLKYNKMDHVFLERLLLLIQVLTNSKMKNTIYIPVIDRTSIMHWVKYFYQRNMVNENLQAIYNELRLLLYHLKDSKPDMFVDRLTGYKNYGRSIQQLASHYDMSIDSVKLQLIGMTHRMLDMIIQDKSQYSFMASIIKDLFQHGWLTQSATKTLDLINDGCSIETISQIRHLKKNTIYDHIVEITLQDPNFPIDAYIDHKTQLEILNVMKQLDTYKLRDIKENVRNDITYFQIRLTIATANNSLQLGDKNDDEKGFFRNSATNPF